MNEILNSGPGIGVFFGMAVTGIILIGISLVTGKKKSKKAGKLGA
jgi:hypothetical protein